MERLKNYETQRSVIEKKWWDFVKDIKNPKLRQDTAIIYENTMRFYKKELLEESPAVTSAQIAPYIKYLFPVLKKLFPNMIAPEIVSVQPMTAPVGAVFYEKYKYASNKGSIAQGTEAIDTLDTSFSSENVKNELFATGDGGHSHYTGTLAYTPVRPKDVNMGYLVSITEYSNTGAVVQRLVDDGSGNFTGDGTGTIDYETGSVDVTFNANVGNGNKVYADYWYIQEANNKMPKFKFELEMKEIRAQRRSLNMNWTAEAAADVKAFQGIDAESEIVNAASSELGLEYDRFILDIIRANVPLNHIVTWSAAVPAGIPDYQHYRSLVTAIGEVAGRIHKDTKRLPANWIVVSVNIANILDQMSSHGDFRPLYSGDMSTPYGASDYIVSPRSVGVNNSSYGIMRIGTLANKYNVYVDPYLPANEILIGLKMDRLFDAGFIWAPYQPMVITPTFLDPTDFTFKKAIMSRNGHYMARPEFYGKINVTNLPF